MKKKILYLRTDIYNQPLIAGGSVSHTVGVIKGMLDLSYSVICASSLMLDQLKDLPTTTLIILKKPNFVRFLRSKINCLFTNIIFTYCTWKHTREDKPEFVYQRYSILN